MDKTLESHVIFFVEVSHLFEWENQCPSDLFCFNPIIKIQCNKTILKNAIIWRMFVWDFYFIFFVFQGEHGFVGSKGEEGEKVNYSVHIIYFIDLTIWHMANQVELCSEGPP